MRLIRRWLREESGATALEYSLIAALIGCAIVTALYNVNGGLTNTLQAVIMTLADQLGQSV